MSAILTPELRSQTLGALNTELVKITGRTDVDTLAIKLEKQCYESALSAPKPMVGCCLEVSQLKEPRLKCLLLKVRDLPRSAGSLFRQDQCEARWRPEKFTEAT
jgi:hypothetical protein